MIKNFQLLIHQVLDSVELNEKTFRNRGSGFVEIYPINYRRACTRLVPREIKPQFSLVKFLNLA